MVAKQRKGLLNALRMVFTPIVKILLHYNISCREVYEVFKATYVEVASKEYGLRGRPTNISRVAAMSGLTRKEVRRIRDGLSNGSLDMERPTVSTSLVYHWCSDQRFLRDDGQPAALDFDTGEHSFRELARTSGGDIPPGALRAELLRSGQVTLDEHGKLQVVASSSNNPKADCAISSLRSSGLAMLSTIAKQATAESTDRAWGPLGLQIGYVRNGDIRQVRRLLSDQLSDFLRSMEQIISAYGEIDPDARASDCRAIGIGGYCVDGDGNSLEPH